MKVLTVAVDAMGGDAAPAVVVEGAVESARTATRPLALRLYGPVATVEAELARHDAAGLPITVADAPDVVGMGEAPAVALRGKPHSSIHRGLAAVRDGEADAFVSAGNTGAVMAAALFVLGRAAGIARPTLLGSFPTVKGRCLVLDVGSNVDCRPEHLVQFARMGALYAERVLAIPRPVVGLMNVGEEPGKGNEQVKETYDLLAHATDLNFRGNIEGRDLLTHAADVVVMDGFVGNVLLKFGESLKTALPLLVGQAAERLGLAAEHRAALGAVLGEVKRGFDYEAFGGAPLLGVAGPVVIGHGSSSAKAIAQMIRAGAELAFQGVAEAIAAAALALAAKTASAATPLPSA